MSDHKILIAEDELLISKVLRMVLEKNKYTVKQVMDESGVLSSIPSFKPDLIVLDVNLRGNSSGIQAGKLAREIGFTGPIVFTTGNSYQQTKNELTNIENFHLFIKPVDPNDLLKYIDSKF